MNYHPVIIIGAPRSGTNMMRDILSQLPATGTWPCDEINYIWRHGNVRYPSDEFTLDMAHTEVGKYIRQEFDLLTQKFELDTVIEKTCANSMRVGFVDRVITGAKYIFMVRDGLDVVGSAMLRWKAKLDIPYLLKKMRYVPISDLPYYAGRYFYNRVHQLVSLDKQLAFWGPQMDDMEQLLSQYNLSQICALQWHTCIINAARDFALIDSQRVLTVHYERFVHNPAVELLRITNFIEKPLTLVESKKLTRRVSSRNIGKGRASLSNAQLEALQPLIGKTLEKYGYG